jgi:hypothetical protein
MQSRSRTVRHCEERSDEAIQHSLSATVSRPGLLRFARNDAFSRCAFLFAPRALQQATARKTPRARSRKVFTVFGSDHAPQKGRRSAERRGVDSAGPPTSVAACSLRSSRRASLLGDALASRRSTAALAKGFRPWLSPVPRFMVADNRSAPRAASSWQTGVWPGGRVSEPPERNLRNRARAPLSLHLQDRIRNVPLRERDGLF